MYCKASVDAKNCLNALGIFSLPSLLFLVWCEKGFRDILRCVSAVVHPRSSAPNSMSNGVSVDEISRIAMTLGCAKNVHKL